jgi:hypothetical protein
MRALYFRSVLVHELGHVAVARHYGCDVQSIDVPAVVRFDPTESPSFLLVMGTVITLIDGLVEDDRIVDGMSGAFRDVAMAGMVAELLDEGTEVTAESLLSLFCDPNGEGDREKIELLLGGPLEEWRDLQKAGDSVASILRPVIKRIGRVATRLNDERLASQVGAARVRIDADGISAFFEEEDAS